MSAHVFHFRVTRPPTGLIQLVAGRAVVTPLYGVTAAPAVAAASLRLVDRWRARIWHLHQMGWERTVNRPDAFSRKWRMLNCPPSTCRTSPSSRPCRVATACPHCWGRWAVGQWREVDLALFGRPQPPGRGRVTCSPRPKAAGLVGTTLVVRQLAVTAPFLDLSGKSTLPGLLDRRLKRAPQSARG